LPANLESSPFGGFGLGVICVLIVVGGLGFPILFEVIGALNKGPRKRRFSANSRLTLAVTGSLLLVGAVSIFMMQTFTHGNELSTQQRFWQSIFYSISSRTAGFNMVPVHQLGATSVLVIMVLMAIGGGPMSTAGGMKTTTVGVLIATAWATVSGRGQAQFAGRTIPDITIHRAVSGVVIYLFVASSATLMLVLLEGLDPWALLFEVVSALSTVGLTLGVTEQLSGPGKFIILTLMLVGRIGLVTFLYAGMGRIEPRRYRYPKDRFFVG
jgi:trk system potassium uptake protein TrkH